MPLTKVVRICMGIHVLLYLNRKPQVLLMDLGEGVLKQSSISFLKKKAGQNYKVAKAGGTTAGEEIGVMNVIALNTKPSRCL